MKFHYDKKIDAMSIQFNDKPSIESEEIRDGVIFDYDESGKIIAIELLDASKVLAKDTQYVEINNAMPIVIT